MGDCVVVLCDAELFIRSRVFCKRSPGIFAFPMLKPPFCARLIAAVGHFESWCKQQKLIVHVFNMSIHWASSCVCVVDQYLLLQRPNTMNNYGPFRTNTQTHSHTHDTHRRDIGSVWV